MDDHTPTQPALDLAILVRLALALMFVRLGLAETAAQLRDGTLRWPTAAEQFAAWVARAPLDDVQRTMAAWAAAERMAKGEVGAAAARLAEAEGLDVEAWATAMRVQRDAPTCICCDDQVPLPLARLGERLIEAAGWVKGERPGAWCCRDCASQLAVEHGGDRPGVVRALDAMVLPEAAAAVGVAA